MNNLHSLTGNDWSWVDVARIALSYLFTQSDIFMCCSVELSARANSIKISEGKFSIMFLSEFQNSVQNAAELKFPSVPATTSNYHFEAIVSPNLFLAREHPRRRNGRHRK